MFGAAQTVAFLKPYLNLSGARILDVGAGKGDVCAQLTDAGAKVFALDASEKAVAVAAAAQLGRTVHLREAASFEVDEPFDAALLSMSAHHIHPLEPALENVRRHLAPGGLLFLEEFAVEECDEESAKWFYDSLALIGEGADGWPKDPLEIWKREHTDERHRFNTGEQMRRLITEKFVVQKLERGPYFYRNLGRSGTPPPEKLFAVEKRLIEAGRIKALGLRIVASNSRRRSK